MLKCACNNEQEKSHGGLVTYLGMFTQDQGKHRSVKIMQAMCRQGRQMSHGG